MNNIHYVQVRIAAVLGALAVSLGAFGAHGLQKILEAHGRVDTWNTAAHYHLIHSAVLLALGLANVSRWGFRCLAAGTIIFSATLYVLSLTGVLWLGAITPIGGTLLIAGWTLVALRR